LFARHPRPRRAGDSPPLTAVESVDCTHRATISPPPHDNDARDPTRALRR
jgi:hypothetical protein